MKRIDSLTALRAFAAGAVIAAIVAGTSAQCASIPQRAQILNDEIIVEVAHKVLATEGSYNQKDLDETSLKVRDFINNMGGENWYANYLKRFGYPTDPALNTSATLLDLTNKNLGVYYIHYSAISAKSLTRVCDQAELSPTTTLKALCALSDRNAAILFNDYEALAKFHDWARWFLENQKDGRWEWITDYPARNQKAPWISALTQSFGISVLLREYQFDNDKAYLDAATKALAWMGKPVHGGGTAARLAKGVWYEEYPDESNPSHVLNGHMWALFGIWDYYRVTKDRTAKEMFDRGVSALKVELDKYDVGYWSVYAQTNRLDMVTGLYMQFIVGQLRVLYAITEIEKFKKVADRWEYSQRHDLLFVHNAAMEFLKGNPIPKQVNR